MYSQIDTIDISPVTISKKITKQKLFNSEIDSSYIHNNKDLQLTDLLKQTQSVFIKSFGNFGASTVSFRGTSATHTQVLWNDIPLNSPMLGQTDFSLVPVFFSDKISTSAGISSLASSSGALGGSILLNVFPDFSKKFSLNFNQTFASFSNFVSSVNLNFIKNKFLLNTRIEYSSGKNDFSFLNTAIPGLAYQKLNNANFSQISFLQNIYLSINKNNQLNLFIWITDANRNIPPIMSFEGLSRTQNQMDFKSILGIKYLLLMNNLKIKNTLAFSYNNLNYFLGDSVFSFPVNDFIIKSNSNSYEQSMSNNFSADFSLSNKIIFNLYNNSEFNIVNTFESSTYSQTGYFKRRFSNHLKGIFIFLLNDNNIFSVILSETFVDRKIYSPVFVLSYKYALNKEQGFNFGLNAGKNLHIPTLNDLFWQPGGNPDLLSENGYSADAFGGFLFSKNNLQFSVKNTVFASFIDNWIIWKPTEFQYWTAQNVKKVFSRGDEFYFILFLKNIVSFKVIFNYSFILSTNQSSYYPDDLSVGKQLIYTPKNTANVFILSNYKNFDVSVNYNFIGKRYTSTSNYGTYALLPYSLLDFSLAKHFFYKNKKFQISLKINNVLNNQYQAILYRPMPGINFRINFSVDF